MRARTIVMVVSWLALRSICGACALAFRRGAACSRAGCQCCRWLTLDSVMRTASVRLRGAVALLYLG